MSIVVPAVLPSSLEELKEKLALFARISSVNRIQIDVVDGRFVGPASWPYTAPAELQAMIKRSEMLPRLDSIEYEIDLMCLDAADAAKDWLALGATRLTFHAETATDLPKFMTTVRRDYGGVISFGLAINIASDLALIEPCLDDIDYVQFMGIAKIGQQGQPFDRRVLEKVRMFRIRHPDILVQVDGGLSLPSARQLVALGVSSLVVGSGILRASDPAAEVEKFESLRTSYGI
ncbi:MAG: hypothetical protein WC217_00305 [Candidatus Paceibacterota bacterium]|jgi:ribulose-phosphate 3-epimerase